MSRNPYSNALFSIAVTGVGMALVAFLIGIVIAHQVLLLCAAVIFVLGVLAVLGWLVVEGIRWQGSTGSPTR